MKHFVQSVLYTQRDAAPLALFRIGMGLLMSAEGFGAILTGWVKANYVDPPFSFHFIGFDFLHILVGPQAYAVYFLLGVFGLMIALGYRYRFAVGGYTLLWTMVYLGQKTSYNNHYYLLMILCFLLLIIPTHAYLSLDAKKGYIQKSATTAQWHILTFKWLLLIVYVYAAIAKLYPDWLQGEPVRLFLSGKTHYPLVGTLFTEYWFIMLISYGGILFDFLIIPALWWRKTRIAAFGVAIFFHIFNSIVFQIGIFPYMMLIASVLYFDEKSMRRLFVRQEPSLLYERAIILPKVLHQKLIATGLILFFLMMIGLPLRHFFYPTNVHWSEEGHRLSWHMMLRAKSGSATFRVQTPDGTLSETINPNEYMSPKMARKMASHPDMLWQFAQRLAKIYEAKGYSEVQVYADAYASLNGRPRKQLIDPSVNLAAEPWLLFTSHPWILKEANE